MMKRTKGVGETLYIYSKKKCTTLSTQKETGGS